MRTAPPKDYALTDTTSHGELKTKLSPFYLGSVTCYQNLTAQRMENAWQFSKVYPEQADSNNNPLPSWYDWRDKGFDETYAFRHPMGHNKPLYTFWDNEKLDYISTRKKVYIPMYTQAGTDVQMDGWTDTEKEQYRRILSQADNVELCSEHKDNGSEKIRNARLVELADICVCFYNTSRRRSGTGQTVRMAYKKGIEIINIAEKIQNN